ncbi:hypothetical protein C5167_008941 [Papaver somniferum]|uniref:Uncharacterized protein n=1 Tax=Papaver somniferum TaxID=3469 RepID=A0A4Y7JXE6_PAPSO|nr:hypothetical protein C5167_008941 [Papaver somniferum]
MLIENRLNCQHIFLYTVRFNEV